MTVNIKKILYPTDFSTYSLAALPFAVDMAKRYGAELHCVHILDTGYEFFSEGGYLETTVTKTPIPIEELRKSAEEQMSTMIHKYLASAENSVVRQVIMGTPSVEIINYAEQENIDLIVIGTHGRSALASMLMGSVTEKVLHKALCPVLAVKHPEYEVAAS